MTSTIQPGSAGDVLSAAAVMVIDIGWTQGELARDAAGTPCKSIDPDAVSWCVIGAILAASVRLDVPPHIKRAAWRAASAKIPARVRAAGLSEWNDHLARTPIDAGSLLRIAAASAA